MSATHLRSASSGNSRRVAPGGRLRGLAHEAQRDGAAEELGHRGVRLILQPLWERQRRRPVHRRCLYPAPVSGKPTPLDLNGYKMHPCITPSLLRVTGRIRWCRVPSAAAASSRTSVSQLPRTPKAAQQCLRGAPGPRLRAVGAPRARRFPILRLGGQPRHPIRVQRDLPPRRTA